MDERVTRQWGCPIPEASRILLSLVVSQCNSLGSFEVNDGGSWCGVSSQESQEVALEMACGPVVTPCPQS